MSARTRCVLCHSKLRRHWWHALTWPYDLCLPRDAQECERRQEVWRRALKAVRGEPL